MEKYIATKELSALDLVKCPGCKGIHFRHTGNVLATREWKRIDGLVENPDDGNANIETDSFIVYVCVGCGKPWVRIYSKLYDATEYIDVKKFDAVNRALQDETKTDPHC